MWLFKLKIAGFFGGPALAIIATVALMGCGFRPLYAPGGGDDANEAAGRLAAVHVDRIPNREGQLLRNELIDLLDPGRQERSAQYRLRIDLEQRQDDVAVEDTGFATRANVRIEARYVLVDQSSGVSLTTGRSRVVTSYNITDSQFSTYTTAESVRERSIERIAHDIRRRLAAYFVSNPPPEGNDTARPAPGAVEG